MTQVRIEELQAENVRDALGIGAARPRLSWVVSADPSWRQRAYTVEVTRAGRTTTYGPVADSDSRYRPWPAEPLEPREPVAVRVRVHGDDGADSEWSAPLPVERALTAGDWRAAPVGAPDIDAGTDHRRPSLVRRAFATTGPVARARLYVTAHGLCEVEINGHRVGDEELAPGWSPYGSRLRFRTHDVTAQLTGGDNVIGAWLGDGWYRGRIGFGGGFQDLYGTDLSLIAQLEITYADASREVVATDSTWRWAPSPILSSGLYDGEEFDARLVPSGWSSPGFDDGAWSPVRVGHRDPATLDPADGPPVRRTGTVRPARCDRRAPDRLLVDLGQNLVGRMALRVSGRAGQEVVLRHAEVLEDGELCVRPLRGARATDRYVLAGGGPERWEPRFTYHGFRHVEVTAPPEVLDHLELEARVLHSDMRRAGWFSCSDPELNRLHDNVLWSTRGNFLDVPTDCPQRDERLGWTGDIAAFAPTACYLFDTGGMLGSWLRDLALEQLPDGTVPWYSPVIPGHHVWTPIRPGAAWGDAAVLTPWSLYVASGDLEMVRRQWDSARAWVDLLERRAGADRLWTGDFQLGDWLDPAAPPDDPAAGTTDPDLVATAYLAHSARRLADLAAALDRTADEQHYAALAADVRAALVDRWTDGTGILHHDSQCGYALLLSFEILQDAADRQRAGARLRELVETAGHRIATGFVGTPLVSEALASTGHLDTAYRQLLERGCPSWLYPVSMGATTIWERWDSMLPDGDVNPGDMTSFNHYALGAVAHWMHATVAGLAPASPGWRTVRFRPRPGGGLTWARGAHDGPYGRVAIEWSLDGDALTVETTVPTGSTAVLELPDGTSVDLGPGRAVRRCLTGGGGSGPGA